MFTRLYHHDYHLWEILFLCVNQGIFELNVGILKNSFSACILGFNCITYKTIQMFFVKCGEHKA